MTKHESIMQYNIISIKENNLRDKFLISLGWNTQALFLERKHSHCTDRKIWLRSSLKIDNPLVLRSCATNESPNLLNTNLFALKQKIFFYKKRKRRNLEKKKIGLSCCVPLVKGRKIYIDTTHNPVK